MVALHITKLTALIDIKGRHGSRGGEMGEFSPPFLSPLPFFLIPQPGFGSITLLQKFTPNFKILDPRLKGAFF